MTTKAFLDTNVLVYAFESSTQSIASARAELARQLIADGPCISVQVLNEFVRVAKRKLKFDASKTSEALNTIYAVCGQVTPVTFDLHSLGVSLCWRYGFEIFDSVILASAITAGGKIFYTEDLQHGQIIEGLRIVNPFKEAGN